MQNSSSAEQIFLLSNYYFFQRKGEALFQVFYWASNQIYNLLKCSVRIIFKSAWFFLFIVLENYPLNKAFISCTICLMVPLSFFFVMFANIVYIYTYIQYQWTFFKYCYKIRSMVVKCALFYSSFHMPVFIILSYCHTLHLRLDFFITECFRYWLKIRPGVSTLLA